MRLIKPILPLLSFFAVSVVAGEEEPNTLSAESLALLMKEMIWVEGGTFAMGSDCEAATTSEKPANQVTLDGFHIGKYEVSQELFEEIMGWNNSYFPGDGFPVNNISWRNIQLFLDRLNAATDKHFRLPTEAEWEYAAKGGKKSKGYAFSGSNEIAEVAWYSGNSKKRPHPSGKKKANELGIHDMTGNLWEFCHDEAIMRPYPANPRSNPLAGSFEKPFTKAAKITRGGGYEFDAEESFIFRRDGATPNVRLPDIGFRIVMVGEKE
ncbi:formylglycine-generating enzyme family protein [Haloferula sp.]|uniref:formylglycine-generating enzyme family protein n=1 Tax=Haloferula sp. TaxID=2497595 RepID=UPI00329BE784